MAEKNLQNEIHLAVSKQTSATLFRNNTGSAWQSNQIIKNPPGYPTGSIVLINPHPLKAGLVNGGSDLIGWDSIEITPDMVGKKLARFTALEVKTSTGKISDAQKNFINAVNYAGGRAETVRTPEQAVDVIRK